MSGGELLRAQALHFVATPDPVRQRRYSASPLGASSAASCRAARAASAGRRSLRSAQLTPPPPSPRLPERPGGVSQWSASRRVASLPGPSQSGRRRRAPRPGALVFAVNMDSSTSIMKPARWAPGETAVTTAASRRSTLTDPVLYRASSVRALPLAVAMLG